MKGDLVAARQGRDDKATDAAGRGFGVALLELSAGLEGAVIRREAGATTIILAALVARGRRLLRAAYRLIDDDAEPEAAALFSVMEDYLVTIRWLLGDPERRTQIWAADGLRRHKSIIEGATKNGSVDVITPELKQEYERLLVEYTDAVRKLGEEPRLPNADRTAAPSDTQLAYSIPYRMTSQSAVHASKLAVDDMLIKHPKGRAIRAKPRFSLAGVSPYLVGAHLMLDLVILLSDHVPELGLGPGVDRLRRSMVALRDTGNGS